MSERAIRSEDVFRDLQIITEANEIIRSDVRISAIREVIEKQNAALSEAEGRTPLVEQITVAEAFNVDSAVGTLIQPNASVAPAMQDTKRK